MGNYESDMKTAQKRVSNLIDDNILIYLLKVNSRRCRIKNRILNWMAVNHNIEIVSRFDGTWSYANYNKHHLYHKNDHGHHRTTMFSVDHSHSSLEYLQQYWYRDRATHPWVIMICKCKRSFNDQVYRTYFEYLNKGSKWSDLKTRMGK